MRVLVTGAAGFVGGAVTDTLAAAGHQVTSLVRSGRSCPPFAPGVEVVAADLVDFHELELARLDRGFDAVCHLAALTRVRESRYDPLRYFAVNVTGTANLLRLLERGTKAAGTAPVVVLGSTCAVYGTPEIQPIPESTPPAPTHPYGASKLAAEQLVVHQAATGGIGAVVLRSFNVAGAAGRHADNDQSRIIPAALAVAAGRCESFGVNGDGAVIREYVHVADMAEAYLAALDAVRPGHSRIFNVGTGLGVSVIDVLDAVERVTGRAVQRVHRPPAAEPPVLVADSRRIRAELGWQGSRSTIDRIVADAWDAATSRASTTATSR
ncbi:MULTISPECIES: NAD-dependent epimerase/dehydratase family protein [Protofrankia]|uniref:UDP-glucose 4-epimerase n=1 Tax=Candidatus Protofrankia datiscae TaxID=2716812 RepID=F8B097_9ACTN|nr:MULTISPECIES: NAD-dependent epimerase/dehydratase family protein [Protofrankia]AEH08721.1 UDP-glucose 4-epimerase [Candidatus Protofrankia datiscae]